MSGDPFTRHRGLATWGERLVALDEFRGAAARSGRSLDARDRVRAVAEYRAARPDGCAVEGPFSRVAIFGGVYSNHRALEALLDDAARRGAEALCCLGDLGGFGPSPERVRPLLDQGAVRTIAGNYEESLAAGRDDCACGYTDPRDNRFALLSYRYTAEHTSDEWKTWMRALPRRRRVAVGKREALLVHGSPRRVNEFLFASTTSDAYLETLLEQERCAALFCTHTGLHWHRRLPSGGDAVNVGVLGRPANDGDSRVWYCIAEDRGARLGVELVPLAYDRAALVAEMRRERLPEEFVETVLTGWWTTCLEVLPARERSRSRY